MAISKFDIANELEQYLTSEYPGDYKRNVPDDGDRVQVHGYCERYDVYLYAEIHGEDDCYASLDFVIPASNYHEAMDLAETFNKKCKSYPYAQILVRQAGDSTYVSLAKKADKKGYTAYGWAKAIIKAFDALIFDSDCKDARRKIEALR